MGGVYDPPCAYGMAEWMAHRVRSQGISVFNTVLNGERATAVSAGDNVAALAFGQLIARTGNNAPLVVSLPAIVCRATTAWMVGNPPIVFKAAAVATNP